MEHAQNNKIELTSELLVLNAAACSLLTSADFEKAEQLYKAMVRLEAVNLLWFNLAWAFLKQKKCSDAMDAFSHFENSPECLDDPAMKLRYPPQPVPIHRDVIIPKIDEKGVTKKTIEVEEKGVASISMLDPQKKVSDNNPQITELKKNTLVVVPD